MIPPVHQVVIQIPDGAGGYDPIVIDACITESHSLTNTVTDHPVEEGASVSDHSRPEPRTVSLEIAVSNTPLDQTIGTDYAAYAWGQLLALYLSPRLCRLTTTRAFYPSMAMTSCVSPIDVKTANSMRATIAFKEVRVVRNRFVQIAAVRDPKAQRKNDRGAITTTPEDQVPTPSGALRTADAVKGALGK